MKQKDYMSLAEFAIKIVKLYDKYHVNGMRIEKKSWFHVLLLILQEALNNNDRELSEKISQFLLDEMFN